MPRFEIDPERSRFTVATRPGMPGLGARVGNVRGWLDAAVDGDGSIDLAVPVAGQLTAEVDGIETGNQLVASAIDRWLGDGRTMSIAVSFDGQPRPEGRVDVPMKVTVLDRVVELVGSGRVRPAGDGAIEADGVTMCDPRAFGISLPPLLNLIVHVRWRVTLLPR
jgi:hypothetical protein